MNNYGFRIGNCIHQVIDVNGIMMPITAHVYNVGSIDKFGEIKIIEPENEETFVFKYGFYCPVPLNDTIAKKLGNPLIISNGVDILFVKYNGRFIAQLYCDDSGMGSHEIGDQMKYVHEVQNIYFDLTKKELKL